MARGAGEDVVFGAKKGNTMPKLIAALVAREPRLNNWFAFRARFRAEYYQYLMIQNERRYNIFAQKQWQSRIPGFACCKLTKALNSILIAL